MASKVRVYGKAQNRTALGIAVERLEAIGKGSSEPLDESNPEVNRRTEFIIVE